MNIKNFRHRYSDMSDTPETLRKKICKNYISLYYTWQKKEYDAQGNKFDKSKFDKIDQLVEELELMYGITYDPKTDTFSDEL